MKLANPFKKENRLFANTTDILDGVPITKLQQNYTTPGMLARSSYDNGFAPISVISDEILKRNIHLGNVDDPETDVTTQYHFWNAFSRPNDRMGFMQFMDLLVAGFLSLPELSFLVWHVAGDKAMPGKPEGGFTLDNIAGFTVAFNDCKGYDSQGNEEWQINLGSDYGGNRKYSREDIITLKYSLLPDDGNTGVSPGSASAQEAAIRDRLNQFQRALFDNGATPSIIVTIHARTRAEADAIQQAYEQRNRGADKSGGVIYQTVLNDPIAGIGSEPKIEVTVVGTPNNNLAISEIVEFTNTTIVSNYGVSPIIYGDTTQTTFQNQNLAAAKFMERVQSILVRLFGTIENEISRIVNMSLPFTFVWDDATLEIVEEQYSKAQTQTEHTKAFLALTQAGVNPDKAVEILGLDDNWKGVVITPPMLPQQPSLNIFEQGCTCPEHTHNELLPTKISIQEESAQKKILKLLKRIAKDIFEGQTSNALPIVNEVDQELIDELTQVMQLGADKTGGDLVAGLEIDRSLADFGALSPQTVNNLQKRASTVITNYVDFVTERIASLADDDPAKKVFVTFFREYGESKASTIAQQETKNAYQKGELDVAKNVDNWLSQNEPQSYIVKIWTTTSAEPCRFCRRMNGAEAGIKDSFVPGGLIESDDVTLYLDGSYTDGTIPDAHVNCQCVFKFELKSK